MVFYVFGYGDLKKSVIFWKFDCFPLFKNPIFDKKFWKLVNILYIWLSSIKKYKTRDQCLRKLSKFFLNLLWILRGKLTLEPPFGIPAPSLDRQNNKCFLQFRYQTNFPSHHQELDRSSTPKPLRSRTNPHDMENMVFNEPFATLWMGKSRRVCSTFSPNTS